MLRIHLVRLLPSPDTELKGTALLGGQSGGQTQTQNHIHTCFIILHTDVQ